MNKIITICGSMKFQEQMMAVTEKLELEEQYIVIQCAYFDKSRILTPQEIHVLNELHFRKIEISDAIYVVNTGGYIGESTQKEIEYAHSLNKEVLFYEPISKPDFARGIVDI